MRAVRYVLALGGGRGGVGSSVLGVNMAVYLAQLGKKVILVDADSAGGELHTMLDLPASTTQPPPSEDDEPEDDLDPIATKVPGLSLLPQTYSVGSTVPNRPGRKPRWAKKLRQLDADYVILDLGAGTAPATLDLFLGADLGICVTAPEPPAVEASYRFVRAAFQRRIRRSFVKDRFRIRFVERAQAELPPLPSPRELVRAMSRYDSQLGELALAELQRFRPRLVVNYARLRHDGDLGPDACDMAQRYLGVHFDYVGHIEQDDSVWLSVVRRRPLLIDSPTSKSARNIERIARRILALASNKDAERPKEVPSLIDIEPTLYDVLFTHRGASDDEIRRANRRLRDIYQPSSLALTSLLDADQIEAERSRIDEASDTLLDPVKRRAYDVSTFQAEEEAGPVRDPALDAALEAERAMLREELAREITPETLFTGEIIQRVRHSQGIPLSDISARTKISSQYLEAIEAERFEDLPAVVYLRGFLKEIAKYLDLDTTQVTKTYLRRYKRWRRAHEDVAS